MSVARNLLLITNLSFFQVSLALVLGKRCSFFLYCFNTSEYIPKQYSLVSPVFEPHGSEPHGTVIPAELFKI